MKSACCHKISNHLGDNGEETLPTHLLTYVHFTLIDSIFSESSLDPDNLVEEQSVQICMALTGMSKKRKTTHFHASLYNYKPSVDP